AWLNMGYLPPHHRCDLNSCSLKESRRVSRKKAARVKRPLSKSAILYYMSTQLQNSCMLVTDQLENVSELSLDQSEGFISWHCTCFFSAFFLFRVFLLFP